MDISTLRLRERATRRSMTKAAWRLLYKQLVDRLVGEQLSCEQLQCVSPGILLANRGSSYAMTPELLLQVIAYNRFRGIEGEVLFFYEGLRDHGNTLAEVLKNGPYAQG